MKNPNPKVNTKINWKNYNKTLGKRANISSFLPNNVEEIWYNRHLTGKRGAPNTYSDTAIILCLTISEIYRLPLRQTESFLGDLFLQLGLNITCPNYTVLSRRRAKLHVKKIVYKQALDDALLVDSSGMKMAGDGEWHEKYHDEDRRKTWLKVHLGVSSETKQINAFVCTPSNIVDGHALPVLLQQASDFFVECIGDGAYDNRPCYEIVQNAGLKPLFSIRSGAVVHPNDSVLETRNQAIFAINSDLGKKAWKVETGYHRRSLVENTFFRAKTIFGARVSAKKFTSQVAQIAIRINLLNRFMSQNN